MFCFMGTTYLPKVHFLPNKFTEGTDLSIALSLKYKCQERDFFDKWKNAFSFKTFVLQPIEICVFINQQHMHFVGTKKKGYSIH